MKIEVTQEDIEKGNPSDCWNCPIALAVQRKTGKSRANVGVSYIHGVSSNSIKMPEEAEEFVANFDRGESVQPFTFDLPYTPQT